MKTREPRQNGGKNGRQNTRFWLSPGAYTGSCGSFNHGDVCHICLEALKFINKNVYGGSCMAEFCNPLFSKMAAK